MSRLAMVRSLIAVCAVSGAAAGLVRASPFDSLGYESPTYTLGDLHAQQGWAVSYPGTDAPVVQTAVVASGSQAIALPRNGADTTTSITAWRDFTATTGDVRVATDLRSGTMAAGGFDAVYIYATSLTTDRATILYLYGNGNVRVFDGGTETTVGTWSPNTWYQMTFDFDTVAQKFDLSIDGTAVATNFSFLDAGATAIAGLGFQEYSQLTGGTFYADNTVVTIVPEPAGVAAAAAGAFVAWLARRTRAAGRSGRHTKNGEAVGRMKTQGEIEAAADAIAHCMQSCMGRGPKTVPSTRTSAPTWCSCGSTTC